MNTTFLQIFLIINVFIIGGLTATALRHAYAHFHPHPEEKKTHTPEQPVVHLPPAVKAKLLQVAQTNFQTVLDHTAAEFQKDLKMTSSQLSRQLEKLGTEIVSDEMKRYRSRLDELRLQTESTIGAGQQEMAAHQIELTAKLDARHSELEAQLVADIEAEKQQLTQQIDTKLADAVSSFLIETLGHNVDLGAQSDYLTAMLDEHKADFKKGIHDEA